MSEEEQGVGHGQPIADEGTLALAVPKASDILEKAADLIEPEGRWTQHAFARDASGSDISELFPGEAEPSCFCVYGAINVASGDAPDAEDGGQSAADKYVLRAIGVDLPNQVSEWNDAPERTQAEVVAKLREAAALAREQGQ